MADAASGTAPETAEEQLTRQFYEWELWGRGWKLWDEPVHLEPPFRPFLGHYLSSQPQATLDDGRSPTFFSSLADGIRSVFSRDRLPVSIEEPDNWEPEAPLFTDSGPLTEFQIALPPDTKISKDAAEQFLLSLGPVSRPVSFEIVGTRHQIVVQIACGNADRHKVRAQLSAFFPDAVVTEQPESLSTVWRPYQPDGTVVVEFGLSNEFMRPLRSFERFEPDPLAGVVGSMSHLESDEVAILQILFSPARYPWPENILRAVSDGNGEPFFADNPAVLKLAGQKIARPLYAVVVRIAVRSADESRAWALAGGVAGALRQFSDPAGNELMPLENDGYGERDHALDVALRQCRRSGTLLNTDELVSLVHLPSASVRTEKLRREHEKTKSAPAVAAGHGLVLGENVHGGQRTHVSIGPEQRLRHTWVVGASGTGKSTFLLNLICQDMQSGQGLAVLDPHGDLIDEILGRVPDERVADVILIDPADEEYPVGFNILSAHSDLERNLLASDLVSVFRRLSTSWGDQMNTVFANAVMAFLESTTVGTLADLRRFLVESEFRSQFLQTVHDPDIVYYWQKEFPLLRGNPQGPILTRLDTFLRPKLIRHMISQKENRLDFSAIMNGRKILLVKLAQGLIGEENSYLLGSVIVSKLNQMVLSRQNVPAAERTPFYLYLDEFHNFVTPSLAAILAGSRKYGLGLVLAHQELHQLMSRDSDVASAVVSNPYTRVCFRLGDFDAKKLEDGFSYFHAKDLQNLGVGQAICRMERSEHDFNLNTMPIAAVEVEVASRQRERVIAVSRERYAHRREVPAQAMPPPAVPVQQQLAADRPRVIVSTAPTAMPPIPPPPRAIEHEAVPRAGRGGAQHKYLQQLIKRWAESHGYRVTIEQRILDGLGSVDVALEKGDQRIACEISITTSAEHELGNIQKCLVAGFSYVAVLATEKKTLTKIEKAAKGFPKIDLDRIRFVMPEELFAFLEEREKEPVSAVQTVRGYTVKVKVNPVLHDDQKAKRQVIAKTVLQAMQRLREK
jgi:hypothetical protein